MARVSEEDKARSLFLAGNAVRHVYTSDTTLNAPRHKLRAIYPYITPKGVTRFRQVDYSSVIYMELLVAVLPGPIDTTRADGKDVFRNIKKCGGKQIQAALQAFGEALSEGKISSEEGERAIDLLYLEVQRRVKK